MSKLLAILLLPLCCYAQVGVEMPILNQQKSSAINITNLPSLIGNLEHRWVATDLPLGRVLAPNLWTDEVQQVSTWVWFTNNSGVGTAPTNTSTGLNFNGSQALVLSNANPNYLQFPVSGSIKRSIFFVYTTTVGTAGGLLTREFLAGFSGGIYLNLSGSSVNTSGNLSLGEEGSSEVIGTGLKTDGTIQDIGLLQLTITSPVSIAGYTNGTHSATNALNFGSYLMGGLGAGFAKAKMNLIEMLVYTNWSNDAVLASNVHYYRTNVYGGSP